MAHYQKPCAPEEEGRALIEQSVRRQVESVFGWKQCSVRILCRAQGLCGVVCHARVQAGNGAELDFLFANGSLVGVSPMNGGKA